MELDPLYKVKLSYLDNQISNKLYNLIFKGFAIVKEGINEWNSTQNFSSMERMLDDFLLNFAKKAKHITFDIEPLIGYLYAKEMEVKNIRNIMVGKFHDLPNDLIRKRLRKTYAG